MTQNYDREGRKVANTSVENNKLYIIKRFNKNQFTAQDRAKFDRIY